MQFFLKFLQQSQLQCLIFSFFVFCPDEGTGCPENLKQILVSVLISLVQSLSKTACGALSQCWQNLIDFFLSFVLHITSAIRQSTFSEYNFFNNPIYRIEAIDVFNISEGFSNVLFLISQASLISQDYIYSTMFFLSIDNYVFTTYLAAHLHNYSNLQTLSVVLVPLVSTRRPVLIHQKD